MKEALRSTAEAPNVRQEQMRYVATGRVHPERADVNIPRHSWVGSDGHQIILTCDSSQLTVVLEDPPVDGFVAAFFMAKQWAQTATAALGFSLATGYSVELIQLVEESGDAHVFGVRVPELMFEPFAPVFAAAVELSTHDVFFRMALVDYSRALGDELGCAAYCYRAIEAVKSGFGPGEDAQLWALMHRSLGTTRGQVETAVKAFADPVRHGDWVRLPPTDSAQRAEMLRVTRDVLEKYLRFRQPSA